MADDFYCAEVLSGHTPVTRVLVFYHTRPIRLVHIVVIPKRHIASLLTAGPEDAALLLDLLRAVQQVAGQVVAAHGACRVITNCGTYQDSQHLHWHIIAGEAQPADTRISTPQL